MSNATFDTVVLIGINLVLGFVFIILGFLLLCVVIGMISDFVDRFRTVINPLSVHPVHPRVVETSKCQECEIIGPEYTSSYITKAEYLKTEEQDCSICLGSMEIQYIERLRCGHMFHRECLSVWMDLKNQCPTCRAKGCCVRIL